MIRELAHFVRHFLGAARMRRGMELTEALDLYEMRLDEAGKGKWRADLVADLTGDVLEIGAGTGLMFPYFKRGVCLTATDPDEGFLARAAVRAKHLSAQIRVQPASGESLPFPDASFDAVVCSGVLCSVQSMERTLTEVKRVLRPHGQFRLLEHVKSDRLISGLLMDVFSPVWLSLSGVNCHMNRNVEASLKAAGFVLRRVERFQIFADKVPTAFPYRAIWATSP
jgi:ubiquinone/menaquinone biosynthesis C-methylase UbiE